jgi:pyruvate dehydrogenase E2 component (dihydrolipoamide acetyltransferase)
MATEVKLPRLGQGMESGTIVKWLKSEGEKVEKGEPLYELDTDKVTQEVEAEASGVLLQIAVQEGEVEVGRTIAVIGEEGESVPEPSGNGASAAQTVEETEAEEGSPALAREAERERGRAASVEAAPATREVEAAPRRDGGRIKASPLARRIARERGVDLAQVQGTGPEGRVVAEDVERAAAAPAAPAAAPAAVPGEVEVVKLSSMRRTIARRMTEAWQIPVFHLFVSVDMTRALEIRAGLVELHPDERPTISDLLTKVCAAALMRHRELNASFAGESVELHPSANIGIAVAVPDGLVVPVIPECERKSIAEIAAVRADLVERSRAGKLQQADLEGGTFTISNLGMFGIERFTAVINPPQAAILAVGAVEEKAVVVKGQLTAQPRMDLTLTCDHRTVNGAVGAEFLGTVKRFLESPGLAL